LFPYRIRFMLSTLTKLMNFRNILFPFTTGNGFFLILRAIKSSCRKPLS
jgi:hypothetical protein